MLLTDLSVVSYYRDKLSGRFRAIVIIVIDYVRFFHRFLAMSIHAVTEIVRFVNICSACNMQMGNVTHAQTISDKTPPCDDDDDQHDRSIISSLYIINFGNPKRNLKPLSKR